VDDDTPRAQQAMAFREHPARRRRRRRVQEYAENSGVSDRANAIAISADFAQKAKRPGATRPAPTTSPARRHFCDLPAEHAGQAVPICARPRL